MASTIKRKGKKISLNRALDNCDSELLKSYVASNKRISMKEGMQVINWIRTNRTGGIYNISPLQGAVVLGFFYICQALIEEGVSFKSFASIPHPLCIALTEGRLEITKLLLKTGADVNLPFGELYPLAYAMNHSECRPEIVKPVIDAGFPVDGIIHKESKKTALHIATILDRQSVLEYLLSISANPNLKDKKGLTPLHYAAQFNRIEIIKILVKYGAQIDIECELKLTPTMYGIAGGYYDVVKLLIDLGASLSYVNECKKNPMTPLHFAAATCQFKIVQLLLDRGANVHNKLQVTHRRPLHAAAAAEPGQSQANIISLNCIVDLFLKNGAELNCIDKSGCTPLMVAIKSNNLNVAKTLVMNGSLLNNCSNSETHEGSFTTFHLAAGTTDKDLIKLCLEHGADPNSKDMDGRNPIHHLIRTYLMTMWSGGPPPNYDDYDNILRLFWNYGYPYDMMLMNGITYPDEISNHLDKQKILFKGLKSMQFRLFKKAVSHGAEFNSCSTEVPYPLHWIASQGNDFTLTFFLSKGVLVNCLDTKGETPLHVAAKSGHTSCCQKLLEYGACFNPKSKITQQTPLQMAKENNHTEVVKLLATIKRIFNNFKKDSVKRAPDIKILHAVMNSKCRSGDTLLTRGLKLKRNELVVRLMDLRLNAPNLV